MDFFEVWNILLSVIEAYINDYNVLLITTGVIFAALHVLLGVGLFSIARKRGNARAWMAFVPFLNSYLIGELAGECSFFGKKVKKAGLWYALAEGVTCTVYGLSLWAQIILSPYVTYYADGMYYDYTGYPASLNWVYTLEEILSYVSFILYIVYIVFAVIALLGFFRKYSTRYAPIFSFLSIVFPVKAAFIFAVRNNSPVNYEEYMKKQREAYYRYRQNYNNPYNNPYNNQQNNPYNNPYNNQQNNPYNTQNNPNKTPYGRGDDINPFEEFFSKNEGDTKDQKENSQNDEFFK